MYLAFIIGFSLFTIVLQTTIFSNFEVKGVRPDLILIIVTYLSLLKGAQIGSILGFSFGLIEDILSETVLGSNALTKTLLGFILGSIGKRLYVNNFLLQIIFVFFLTFINEAFLSGLALMLKSYSTSEVFSHWVHITPIEAFYNAFLCPFLVGLLRSGERAFGSAQK